MANTTTAGDSRQLRGDLDRLVRRARKVLDRAYLGARSRQVLCRTLTLSFVFALPLLLVELVRYVAGYASFGLHGWQYAAVVAGGAGVFALGWLLRDFLRHVLPRGTTLGLFDRQLKLANRLATADEFIGTRERTGFMQAAIDDAIEPVQRAMGSKAQAVGSDRRWPLSRGALLSVPATVGLLLLTIWFGTLERLNVAGELFADTTEDLGASPDLSAVDRLEDEAARRSSDERPAEKTAGAEPGETADAAVPDSFDSSASQPGGQPALLQGKSQPSAGQPSGGVPSGAGGRPAGQPAGGQQSASGHEAATSEQNRQAGSERQQASAQQQAGATENSGQQSASQQSASGREAATAEQNQEAGSEQQQASAQQQAGSTQSSGQQSADQSSAAAGSDSAASGDQSADSGQESVAGNDSAAAANDSAQSAQGPQNAPPQSADQQAAQQASQRTGQRQGNESGRAEDRGQTRSQSPGGMPGGGDPNAQAQAQARGGQPGTGEGESRAPKREGRSASNDAIKKNRGAAKAMLAVPKPDRLIGVRGDGPEQIRQEQSVPQEQQAAPVAASARTARGDRIGTLQQTEVSGWSRALVKNYFDRGGSATAGAPGDTPSTTTDSSEGQQR